MPRGKKKIDDKLAELEAKGTTYAEAQKAETIEKFARIELPAAKTYSAGEPSQGSERDLIKEALNMAVEELRDVRRENAELKKVMGDMKQMIEWLYKHKKWQIDAAYMGWYGSKGGGDEL